MGDEVTVGRNRPAHVRRQRPDAMTAIKRQRFLDVVAATANVSRAAEAAGAAPATFYRLRQRDAGFAAAWTRALHDGYAALEARLLAHALGTDEQSPGDADRMEQPGPFDAKFALDVLKRADERARAPARTAKTGRYRYVPIEEVERSLLAKLEALERRLAGGPVAPAAA